MFRGALILALFGVSLASNFANQYIDNILQSSFPLELRALRLDPATLPDFKVNFGTRSIYQSAGEAHFYNGNVTGFNRLRRRSDCQGPKLIGQQYSINCTLSLYPFTTNYDVMVRNGSYIYKIRNMGHVAETLIDIKIVGQVVGHLRSFQITRLGLINPTYHGLPPALNVYTKVISDEYKTIVSTNVFNMLQNTVKYAFERAMANKPLPRHYN